MTTAINRFTGLPVGVADAEVPAELQTLAREVAELVITNDIGLAIAADLLVRAKKAKKMLEAEKKILLEPIKAAFREATFKIEEEFRITILLCDNAATTLNNATSAYYDQRRRQAMEEERVRQLAYQRSIEKESKRAEKKGEPMREVAPPPPAATQAPAKTLRTSSGTLTFMEIDVWEIPGVLEEELDQHKTTGPCRTDPRLAALPNEAFVLDVGWVERNVKGKTPPAGVVVSKKTVPSGRG
jgi:hypothetical protein